MKTLQTSLNYSWPITIIQAIIKITKTVPEICPKQANLKTLGNNFNLLWSITIMEKFF